MKLWIDDLREPEEGWFWAKTSEDAIRIIEKFPLDLTDISFDHDLGGEDTTVSVINLIEEMAYRGTIFPIKMRIHSSNPVGRAHLARGIASAERFWRERLTTTLES